MLKKALPFMLAVSIIQLVIFSVPASVNAQANADVERAVRARAKVTALGVASRVSVRSLDDRRLTGHVRQINENDFIIMDAETGANITIAYVDVKEVKRKNERRLYTGTTVLIVLGVIALIVGILNPS